MNNYIKEFNESDIIKNVLNDYINKLVIYLEQDYELQDYLFKGFEIKYRVKQTIEYTEIILAFPNDFVYNICLNLNVDDLPYFIELAAHIKYMIME